LAPGKIHNQSKTPPLENIERNPKTMQESSKTVGHAHFENSFCFGKRHSQCHANKLHPYVPSRAKEIEFTLRQFKEARIVQDLGMSEDDDTPDKSRVQCKNTGITWSKIGSGNIVEGVEAEIAKTYAGVYHQKKEEKDR
jgi:hypothetical protein